MSHRMRMNYAHTMWTATCTCGWEASFTTATRTHKAAHQHTEKENRHV